MNLGRTAALATLLTAVALTNPRLHVPNVIAEPSPPKSSRPPKRAPAGDGPVVVHRPCVAAAYARLGALRVAFRAKYPDDATFEAEYAKEKPRMVSREALEAAGCVP